MKKYNVEEASNMQCRAGGVARLVETKTTTYFAWPKCDPLACMHFQEAKDMSRPQQYTGYCGLNK